ncbi:MAG: CDP-alcohol phosphatidyltransferase family protein [bacterium]
MIPNIITCFRVALIFPILYFILRTPEGCIVAAVLFSAAAVTDALDGQAARRLNQSSVFGGMFDLVADRVLMMPTLIVMTALGAFDATRGLFPPGPYAYAAVVLSGDVTVLAGVYMFARLRRRDPGVEFPAPTPLAKAAYPAQVATIVAALVGLAPAVVAALMYAAAALTILGFVTYMRKGGFVFTRSARGTGSG